MFNKERLRVYPYSEIIQIAFGSKGERALFGAPRLCMESMVSLSSIGCLSAEIRGQKKHAEVLLTVPRRGAGNNKVNVAKGEAREKLRNPPLSVLERF
jgi:hypothetical protein